MTWLHDVGASARRAEGRVRVRRWRSRPYTSSAAPIVVGGCGRSGTTLLRVMLDSHPRICCGPESALFVPRPVDAERVESLATRFGMNVDRVRQMRRSSQSQAEFVDRFFADCCELTGKPRWADKTPRNVLSLDFVFEHFPNARFVHVIRDGRDVACSLRTHPRHKVVDGRLVELNTWRPMEECARRWADDVRVGLAYRGHPNVTEVRYEDLAADTERALRDLFEWLGEPWDERVLRFHEVEGTSRDVTNFPQNPEATAPAYTRSIGRWRTAMSADDAHVFKPVAGGLLCELGYAADQDWVPDAHADSR